MPPKNAKTAKAAKAAEVADIADETVDETLEDDPTALASGTTAKAANIVEYSIYLLHRAMAQAVTAEKAEGCIAAADMKFPLKAPTGSHFVPFVSTGGKHALVFLFQQLFQELRAGVELNDDIFVGASEWDNEGAESPSLAALAAQVSNAVHDTDSEGASLFPAYVVQMYIHKLPTLLAQHLQDTGVSADTVTTASETVSTFIGALGKELANKRDASATLFTPHDVAEAVRFVALESLSYPLVEESPLDSTDVEAFAASMANYVYKSTELKKKLAQEKKVAASLATVGKMMESHSLDELKAMMAAATKAEEDAKLKAEEKKKLSASKGPASRAAAAT